MGSILKTRRSYRWVYAPCWTAGLTRTQHATHIVSYNFTDAVPRDAESVGLDVGGRAMLVPAEKFKALVKKIEETYSVTG